MFVTVSAFFFPPLPPLAVPLPLFPSLLCPISLTLLPGCGFIKCTEWVLVSKLFRMVLFVWLGVFDITPNFAYQSYETLIGQAVLKMCFRDCIRRLLLYICTEICFACDFADPLTPGSVWWSWWGSNRQQGFVGQGGSEWSLTEGTVPASFLLSTRLNLSARFLK